MKFLQLCLHRFTADVFSFRPRRTISTVFFLLAAAITPVSYAACTVNYAEINVGAAQTISSQDIANTPVGGVIGRWSEFNQYVFHCQNDVSTSQLGPALLSPAPVPAVNSPAGIPATVYNTNIGGIGVALVAKDPRSSAWVSVGPAKRELIYGSKWSGMSIVLYAAYVKTASTVSSGTIRTAIANVWTEYFAPPFPLMSPKIPLVFGDTTVSGNGTICDYSNNTSAAAYRFSAPTLIAVDGNTPPGTVLWSSSPVRGDRATQLQCGQGGFGGLESYWSSTSFDSGGYQVQPTNIPGIGYSISYTGFPSGIRGYPNNGDSVNPGNNNNNFQATLRFVRTAGPMPAGPQSLSHTSGGLNSFTTWYVGNNKARFANFFVNDVNFGITRPSGTCNINDYTFNLGSTRLSDLKTVGTKTPSKRFNVYANCPNISSTPVYFTVNDIQKVGGTCDKILSNLAKNGATGVGVYLSWNNSNTSNHCFGQEERMADSNLSGASNTQIKIGLDVGMIQLTEKVTPGAVQGKAIITVNYR